MSPSEIVRGAQPLCAKGGGSGGRRRWTQPELNRLLYNILNVLPELLRFFFVKDYRGIVRRVPLKATQDESKRFNTMK